MTCVNIMKEFGKDPVTTTTTGTKLNKSHFRRAYSILSFIDYASIYREVSVNYHKYELDLYKKE